MKKLIYRYLTNTYEVVGNRVYIKSSQRRYGIASNIIKKDVNKIFGINDDELKRYLRKWMKRQNGNFEFKKFWKFSFPKYQAANGSVDMSRFYDPVSGVISIPIDLQGGDIFYHHHPSVSHRYVNGSFIDEAETREEVEQIARHMNMPIVEETQEPASFSQWNRYANRDIDPSLYQAIRIGNPLD